VPARPSFRVGYSVYVVDVETQQLIASQLLDGEANKILSPRVKIRKGHAPTTEPYFAGVAPSKGRLHHIAIIYDTSFLTNYCHVDLSLHFPSDIPR